jgi:Leucine-rich repeat (LRR) protein
LRQHRLDAGSKPLEAASRSSAGIRLEPNRARTLVLADNHLSEVSDQISRLRKLRMLDLGRNQLTRLPDALADLDGLTDFLYLHDNRLASLPWSLARLTKLRYLNISENAFEIFPECVSGMASLIELRVTHNKLSSLPDSIARLTNLRELHLRKQPNDHAARIDRNVARAAADRSARQPADALTHGSICDG